MDDQEYDNIFNYLKYKYIPADLPMKSNKRRNWAQRVRKNYKIIREEKGTALLEFVGIKYSRGSDALGERVPMLLRVPKKSDWP